MRIYQVETREDIEIVKELFWEYLQWANEEVNKNFGVSYDIKTMLEVDIDPYPESEIPTEFQPNWIFMEKRL